MCCGNTTQCWWYSTQHGQTVRWSNSSGKCGHAAFIRCHQPKSSSVCTSNKTGYIYMSCFFVLSFVVCFVIWGLLFFCNDFCCSSWVNKTAHTCVLEYKKMQQTTLKNRTPQKRRRTAIKRIVQSSFLNQSTSNKTLQPFQFSYKNGSVY